MDWFFPMVVTAGVLIALLFLRLPPDLVFLGGLTLLVVLGVVQPEVAFSGFANPGLVTMAALLLVVEGLRQTGAMEMLSLRFGAPRSPTKVARCVLPWAALVSAFINNTPVVAALVPMLTSWARRFRYPASKVLLPLALAVSLGGLCTLAGTSTNLLVAGMAWERGLKLDFFTPAAVGVPIAIFGLFYLIAFAPALLPSRESLAVDLANSREYAVEMHIQPGSPLAGKTVEEAGLRHLVGVYLAEIQRQGKVLPAVAPTEVLLADDRLVFVGAVDSILDLQKLPGLVPANDQLFKLDVPRHERQVLEVLVAPSFPLIGQTVREGRFRTTYGAVIIAVSRQGKRLPGKVGEFRLEPGDILLLEAPPEFVERFQYSREFFLLTQLSDNKLLQYSKAWLALGILLLMVTTVALGFFSLVKASLMAAAITLISGCLPFRRAWQAMDWPLLLTLGGALGMGQALQATGTALKLAQGLTSLMGAGVWASFLGVFLATSVLTQLISNSAAAALIFPVGLAVAQEAGANPMTFVMGIMVAASSAFLTPWGYQTNLLVQGPGNYRLGDFLRVGLPLWVGITVFSCWWIPKVWPF